MRVWERARLEQRCGACDRTVAIGEPIQLLTKCRKVRCEACATEPAPELPALVAVPRAVSRTPVQPMLAVRSLALDWKQRAMPAEREPGEDG